jgi:hypothetical protein
MRRSLKVVSIAALAVGATLQLAAVAQAQVPGQTKDEFKCESGTGKTLSKFVGAKDKCITKCLATARKTSGPYAGCFAPYADPAVNACITDPVKGAEAKARAGIVKSCTKDCPECYGQATCDTGEPFVTNTEGQLDVFATLIDCLEASAQTPTKDQAKCEDTVGKSLSKFVGLKSKCYQKCNTLIAAGKLPVGSCDPPTPSDAKTQACITTAETKTAATIDKLCAAKSANPACYGTAFDTGAEWVAVAESAVDAQTPIVACGSPSGAFLQ